MFITFSWKFYSLTYLSDVSKMNFGCPVASIYSFAFDFPTELAFGQGPVSVPLNAIMTTAAACKSAWITISFTLLESATLLCML